jgi:aminoglycoside phosphotransferase (APT) family kinase protein
MAQLMEQQHKSTPPVLGKEAMRELGRRIKDALNAWAQSNVPDTLGHLDLNPGNILASSDQCIFLDWAEAYVGPPFLTFQYLIEHLSQSPTQNLISSQLLVDHYFSDWLGRVARVGLSSGQRLMRLLAVFAYATASDWTKAHLSRDERFLGYLRSLTRRLQREASMLDANGKPAGCA